MPKQVQHDISYYLRLFQESHYHGLTILDRMTLCVSCPRAVSFSGKIIEFFFLLEWDSISLIYQEMGRLKK
jgi:hypothetical protein